MLLACYTEFEDRLGTIANIDRSSSAYDIVKRYTEEKLGKFTSADVIAHCPGVGRSSVLAALKRLTAEGRVIRYGSGRSTFYARVDDS